jgi:hypothetical protein
MTCSNIFVVERSERQHRPQLGAPAERKRPVAQSLRRTRISTLQAGAPRTEKIPKAIGLGSSERQSRAVRFGPRNLPPREDVSSNRMTACRLTGWRE